MPKDDTAYGPSSNPSSSGYKGGGGGGNRGGNAGNSSNRSNSGGGNWSQNTNAARNQVAGPRGQGGPPAGTGLTTGKTVYGNTAYGPAGGRATGYATMSRPGANYGVGPSTATYSNYRNLDGSQRFAGNPSVTARNAGVGANQIAARQPAMAPAVKPTGGLLDPQPSTIQSREFPYGSYQVGGYEIPGYIGGDYGMWAGVSGQPINNKFFQRPGIDTTYPGGYGQVGLAPGISRPISPSTGLQRVK